MTCPFPPSSSAPGDGRLVVELLPNAAPALSLIKFQYPLKLISPSASVYQKSALVFLLTYGGGLVGGDQVNLSIDVKENAKLSVVTQGHTKVFKSPTRKVVTRQQLQVTIEAGAALCLLPDPVQPFESSVYEQSQAFRMHNSSSLCILDWVSAGRTARGEDWDLTSWSGRNEIWLSLGRNTKSRLLLRDKLLLDEKSTEQLGGLLSKTMHDLGIFGTLILKGPQMDALASFVLMEFSSMPRIGARDFRSLDRVTEDKVRALSSRDEWRNARLEQEKEDGVLWSAAKIRGCTVVKFGARTVEGGRNWVGSMIKEEGSVERNFGEQSLMCVR